MLNDPFPSVQFPLCVVPRWVCNPGLRFVPLAALVVLCKTQSRGRDVTPNEGEAPGTVCRLCVEFTLFICCAFLTRFIPVTVAFAAQRHTTPLAFV